MKAKSTLITLFAVAAALTLQFGIPAVYAAGHKVDCSQVMTELQSGKKVAEVAKEMKISRSSVYRCRKQAAKESKESATMGSPGAMESPAPMASPAAAPAGH